MAYTRTFQDTIQFPSTFVRVGTAPYSYSTLKTVNLNGSRSGTAMPNWREIVRAGGNATTPYTLDRTKLLRHEPASVQISAQQVNTYGKVVGTIGESYDGYLTSENSLLDHLIQPSTEAEAAALTSIYKKIESGLSHLNSAAVLAEGADVLRQFGAPFNSLTRLTNRHLDRLFYESRGLSGSVAMRKVKWLQIVANTYLEYSFGLRPLISDTRKAAEALARWQHESELKFRSKAVGRGVTEKATGSTTLKIPTSSRGIVFTNVTTTHTETRVQYIVGLKATPLAAFGSNDRLTQLLGFTPEKWIPAIWEVVPWSFLIDYVANVGDILNASVTSTAGVTWISKAVTRVTVRKIQDNLNNGLCQDRLRSYGFNTGYVIRGRGCSSERVRTTLSRTAPQQLGVPPLTLTLPGKDEWMKYLNAAALLVSRRGQSSNLWLV